MSYDPIIFPTKVPSSNNIFTELVAPHQNRNFIALVGYRRTGKSLFASTLKNENTSLYVYEDLDYKDGKKNFASILAKYTKYREGDSPKHIIMIFRNYWSIPDQLKNLITKYILFGKISVVREIRLYIFRHYFEDDKIDTHECGFTIPEHKFSQFDPVVMVDVSGKRSYHNSYRVHA